MLFEMATGNLSFRIQGIGEQPGLDEIAGTLNTLSEKMLNVILESGHVNPHYTYQNLTETTFVLNNKFQIIGFNATAPVTLGFDADSLLKMDFSNIISSQSKSSWNKIKDKIVKDGNFHTAQQLILLNSKQLLMPSFCTVSRLLHSNAILISSVTTILQDLIDRPDLNKNYAPRKSDAAVMQDVYDYILNHLEEPLPTIKELAQLFGTNDFKLKDGFRHFFNTSIYQFYSKERLKRAHLLIQQTPISLKEIAFRSGYNDYTNFSKAFKKQYYYTPSDLQREEYKEVEIK